MWRGPPLLYAVREDIVRNRMLSTSLRYDPYTALAEEDLDILVAWCSVTALGKE